MAQDRPEPLPDNAPHILVVDDEQSLRKVLAATLQREGYEVMSVPVNHRERTAGRSKYGVHNRLWVGIVDLFGVMWLQRRVRRPCRGAARRRSARSPPALP